MSSSLTARTFSVPSALRECFSHRMGGFARLRHRHHGNFPAMEEATTRTVIGNGCELDSRFRSLFYRERAGRVHVRLHAAGMRGIHFYPRAAQHLGQVNGEGVDCRFARVVTERVDIGNDALRIAVLGEGAKDASMRRQSRGFEDSSSSSFVFCGGGIGLPSGLGVLVHVLIRRLPQRRNVAISISRSLWWSHCTQTAIVPNRPSSVGAQEFPPNACRGERCGVWGRRAPIRLLQAIVGKGS